MKAANSTALFDEQWDAWLAQELALYEPAREDWRKVLARFELDQIKILAQSFVSGNRGSAASTSAGKPPRPLRDVARQLSRARPPRWIARHPDDRHE